MNWHATKNIDVLCTIFVTGPRRASPKKSDRTPSPRALGHVGPDAHLGGPVCCGQHFLQPQVGLHFLRQPLLGASPSDAQQNGDRHTQVCLFVLPRPILILLW